MFTLSLLHLRDFDLRRVFRFVLVTAFAIYALPAQPQQAATNAVPTAQTFPGPSANSSSSINVQYTGRLFGYYRVEPDVDLTDLQNAYDAEVAAKKSNSGAALPSALLTRPGAFLRHKKLTSPDLLLGMGDNFGPEFGASIQSEFSGMKPCRLDAPVWEAGRLDTYAPESLYKSESRKPLLADCDNVTRFLMAAGYRAIVPGREDFLYNGTWLRRVAYLLRGVSSVSQNDSASENYSAPHAPLAPVSPDLRWTVGPMPGQDGKCDTGTCAIASFDHKLHMLSANLRVNVAPGDGQAAAKSKSCPLLFAADLGAPVECGQSDSTVSASMEWLARVDGALKPKIHASMQMQALDSTLFAKQVIKNEISILNTIVAQAGVQTTYGSKAECKYLATDLQTILSFNPDKPAAAEFSLTRESAESAARACPSAFGPLNGDLLKLIESMEKAITYFNASAKSPRALSPLLDEAALGSAQQLLLQLIFDEQQDAGFTIATSPGGRRVLLIGVEGQETMQEVAPEFFTVYPDVFDCPSAAAPSSANPACELKQRLFDAKNPPGSAAESKFFKQAESDSKNAPFSIKVGDPLLAAEAVLRAVWANELRHHRRIDLTILMAQMPATEAEEVGSQLRYDLGVGNRTMGGNYDLSQHPHIDLVLSEAQDEHITANQVVDINPLKSTVVLSPPLAYESVFTPRWYPPSTATITSASSVIPNGIEVRNTLGFIDDPSTSHLSKAVPIFSGRATSMAQAAEEEDESTSNPASASTTTPATAASLLESLLEAEFAHNDVTTTALTDPWKKCNSPTSPIAAGNCQNQVLTSYLLHMLQTHYKTSAAILKRRDFWFGKLARGYDDYTLCDHWVASVASNNAKAKAYCELHVALDRVLWRGDYSVRVLVDGNTLASVLNSSRKATSIETTRLANDLHEEWLSTFGLVSTPPTDLVAAASGPESFSLPGVNDCSLSAAPPLGKKAAGPPPTAYCVDGFTLASDAAYWIATSTQLAKDQSTYSAIQNFTQAGSTRFVASAEKRLTGRGETFLTTAIAAEILHSSPGNNVKQTSASSTSTPKANTVQDDLARIEATNQKRPLVQFDVSKFVAGYTFTAPSLSDTNLGNGLSGVSNTTATTPHSAELDLEAVTRTITAPIHRLPGLVFGIQNDFEFDHRRTGNISGKPATVSYPLNSETVGAFAQIHIPGIFRSKSDSSLSMQSPRALPRLYWVIAPYQYQRQIVGSPLYFGYLTPPYTKNPSQQDTVTVPISDGFSWKSGLRFESGGRPQAWAPDSGSYVEIGPEYVIQNGILYGISMPDLIGLASPVTTHCANPCYVTAGTSITSAVQAYYKDNSQTLNGSSRLVPLTQTVHAGGFYWTAHVQKVLNKAKTYSISFDTTGDSYLLPGYNLPTQTRYAISNKLAFNMNILGNLSLSPTYSVFNFENQGAPAERISVNTTSFEVMLKWYYGRDTQSPPFRLLWFTGPKSGDQTTTSKLK